MNTEDKARILRAVQERLESGDWSRGYVLAMNDVLCLIRGLDKNSPAPAEALARLNKARESGLDDALVLGWITAMDPALVVRAVEEMESRRVDRAEVEEAPAVDEPRTRGGAVVTFGRGWWHCRGCGLGGDVVAVERDMANEHAGQCWATSGEDGQ